MDIKITINNEIYIFDSRQLSVGPNSRKKSRVMLRKLAKTKKGQLN